MLEEWMLWRRKKQTGVTDGEREADMGGITQQATGNDSVVDGENARPSADGADPTTTQAESSKDVTQAGAGEANGQKLMSDVPLQRFQLKRWNACVYWSWDVMHDTCVICRNAMMSPCIHCQAKVGTNPLDELCAVAWGVCNHAYHLHCIKRWLETSAHPRCPLDNSEWEFSRVGQ
ncbi:unnamed protein product [Dicrocoelium dendriticum]|nr:unnamed protein product [Dicrocoelium dendriticum]